MRAAMHVQTKWVCRSRSGRRHCISHSRNLSFIFESNIWTLIHVCVSKVVRVCVGPKAGDIIWMASFAHYRVFIIDQSLVDVFKSLITLCCDFTVRTWSYLITVLLWEPHIYFCPKHLYCHFVLLVEFHSSHIVNMWGACFINYRFIWDSITRSMVIYKLMHTHVVRIIFRDSCWLLSLTNVFSYALTCEFNPWLDLWIV